MSVMTETPSTEQVLAGMFTENTGRHFLDSGGAYGRNWERQQGKTLDDFKNAPGVTAQLWGSHEVGEVVDDLDLTIDAFNWLLRRVEYAPELDKIFHDWAADSDQPWLEDAETWADLVADTGWGASRPRSWNTYNGDCWLSQTLQGVDFTYEGEEYILLQVHGGCDVRGGYTSPRVFRAEHHTLYDYTEVEGCCTGSHVPQTETLFGGDAESVYHVFDINQSEITSEDGESVTDPFVVGERDGEQFIACRVCGAPVEFFQREVY